MQKSLAIFRWATSLRQFVRGDWTSGYCKSEIDRKGKLMKKNEKGLIIRFQIEILIFLNF
ncbi:MAG: hypothetical protein EAX89_01765 [Candidatus Lokiarchaeota archaeon]|nr:hypothetical protein [Candidatus Lokiarchaeota archaeon]